MSTVPPQKGKLDSSLMTEEVFLKSLPRSVRRSVGDNVLQYINGLILDDPELNDNLRDDLISYTSVLQQGRFKIYEYITAVRYVSFRLLGDTSITAYIKTFPDRYQDWINKGIDERDITSKITGYKNSKLVGLIMAQTMTPVHVMNKDYYQDALNVQRELMLGANSEMVRMKAADSILAQLKPPEIQKIELDIGMKDDPAIDELNRTMTQLAEQQKQMIAGGHMSAKQIAHSKILSEEVDEAEFIEVGG